MVDHRCQGYPDKRKILRRCAAAKTFSTDVISKKVVKNTGQLPKYLIQNHHEGIVTREQFQAAQAELARRSALRSDSKQAATGRSCYTSKYALSDRLVCGECGKLYRRKTRNIKEISIMNGAASVAWTTENAIATTRRPCGRSRCKTRFWQRSTQP